MALNVAEVEPAATVTEIGVVSAALSSDTATVLPPAGAGLVRLTVQVVLPLGPRLVGLQTRVESASGATRLMVTLCEAPLSVAVTVAFWSLAIVPVVALNVAEVEPEVTVTEVGTVSTTLLFDTATVVPPAGAALVSVTVQVLVAFATRLVGLHARVESATEDTKLKVTFCETPFSVAVTVALWSPEIVPVVALNVAEVAAAAIVTEAGVVRAALSSDTVTEVPPAGAALVSVTVQVLEAFGPRLVGLQTSAESATEVARFKVKLCEMLLSVAVTVAG